MKSIISSILLIALLWLSGYSQGGLDVDVKIIDKISLSYHLKSGSAKFVPGQELKVVNVYNSFDGFAYILSYQSDQYLLPIKHLDKIEFLPASSLAEEWEIQMVKFGVLQNLAVKGVQYDLRKELDEDAIDFIYTLENNNFIFKDDYLEDYLQNLVHKIHPGTLTDGRPGNVNVRIVKNQFPNAYSFSNGTIFVTTGLLSVINSEEELLGVLAHEIAHFILDHAVININKQIDLAIKRQQRAEFWAGVAAAVGTAAEVYMATQHNVYFGGTVATSAAAIAYSIASDVSNRMGLNYESTQEQVADATARAVLRYLSIPTTAYSSAMMKIGEYLYKSGNSYSLMGSATHPALINRYPESDKTITDVFYSNEYHTLISLVTTFNATLEFASKHFIACEELVDRNINAGLGIEEDYILKAMVTRILYNSTEKNLEALDYLNTAKNLNVVPNIVVNKQEGITYLRLKQKIKAKEAFNQYLDAVYEKLDSAKENYFGYISEATYRYWAEEIEWTRKMIFKIDKM